MAEVVEELAGRHEDVFEKIECIFCGCDEFTEIRFEGVFCAECNAKIKMRLPGGDSGSIVTFLPNMPDRDNKYVQKYLSGDDEPYWTSQFEQNEEGNWKRVESENGGDA